MPNKHTKRTMFKQVIKDFDHTEIEVANIIMQRIGSIELKKAFANDVKCLYLYAAREVIKYLEKHILT